MESTTLLDGVLQVSPWRDFMSCAMLPGSTCRRWIHRRPTSLAPALAHHGWHQERHPGIIVTHGHLDHILNVAPLAR